jgi:hypothetical protein
MLLRFLAALYYYYYYYYYISQTIVTQGLTYITKEQSIATIQYNDIHDKLPYTVPLCSRYLQAVYHAYTNSGITPHRAAQLTSLQKVS